jgi:hypothetical protein
LTCVFRKPWQKLRELKEKNAEFKQYSFGLKESVMNEDRRREVNTNSAEFKEGVEAGLNSDEDTQNWEAGNDLGQALKDETGEMLPVIESHEPTVPVFMRSSPERKQGNAQDEKDESAE